MEHSTPAVTRQIAQYVHEVDVSEGPKELRERALEALVDTVGVTIGARRDSGFVALLKGTNEEFRPGPATIFATGESTSPANAALINGMGGHALDYDDVADPIYGHPSIALYPALFALAEAEGATGVELLDAYVAGFEVAMAISTALPIRPHYSLGWHSTATVGVVAAAAAASRLLKLPLETTQRALGIAASMASGSRQNFGTQTKPLHPGLAGRSAVTAVRLAQSGLSADTQIFEAPLGFFAMYGVESSLENVQEWFDQPWSILNPKFGIGVKKYPCCYATHRTADAALNLASKIDPGAVTSVRLTLEPGAFDALIHHRPTTGLEGKFSAEYVVAAGLLDRRIGLATFTDESVDRPAAQALLRRVEIGESATPPEGSSVYEQGYAVLEIDAEGATFSDRVDVARGDSRNRLSFYEIKDKFVECVTFSGVSWDAAALLYAFELLPSSGSVAPFRGLGVEPIIDRT